VHPFIFVLSVRMAVQVSDVSYDVKKNLQLGRKS
jgi:hypothetical protein